jgi:hypothetical protein
MYARARMTDAYNYDVFDLERENQHFDGFLDHLHVGTRPPGFELEDLASSELVKLSSLWRTQIAILEFGSFT